MKRNSLLGIGIMVAISAIGLAVSTPAAAREKSSVKAALVYNIMRFVSFPGDPQALKLCGLNTDDTGDDLRRLEGRSVGGAAIDVQLYTSAADMPSNCNVIYLDSASPGAIGTLSRGQVLIGSATNFAQNGGTVGLISFGGQVRFEINDGAARRAGVRFSSQLLQLAARVMT